MGNADLCSRLWVVPRPMCLATHDACGCRGPHKWPHAYYSARAFRNYQIYCPWGKASAQGLGHIPTGWVTLAGRGESISPREGEHRHTGHTAICLSTACQDASLHEMEAGLRSSLYCFRCGFHHLSACPFPVNVSCVLMFSDRGCYARFGLMERWPSMLREGKARNRTPQVSSKINPTGTEEPKKKKPTGF